ncbi:spermatogenesis-associated serine-rich protein 1 isoform X2 [Macrotis lagotis]|uniref:spermatogenesis-associated serine-rich protein 1 isoform X2 n=1 Tax=Macrotis lagotis TaxID=92651 RepID=UPI003D692058
MSIHFQILFLHLLLNMMLLSAVFRMSPKDMLPMNTDSLTQNASHINKDKASRVYACHPVADRELQPSPFPSMKVIDVPLVTQVGENDYPREVKLLHQKGAEWSFYPREGHLHTYCKGKRCYFNGVYCAYQRCSTEMTLDKSFGRKKYDIDPRNGIPELIPGDKVYLNVEDSPDFYKHGATIPPVNFSKTPYIKKVDTFIPLEPLPQEYHLPYSERKKKEEKNTEIMEVKELNEWKPAIPIMEWLFPNVLQHTKRVIII